MLLIHYFVKNGHPATLAEDWTAASPYLNLYCLTISLAVKPDCITLTGSIA
jgi:hypothetical protein